VFHSTTRWLHGWRGPNYAEADERFNGARANFGAVPEIPVSDIDTAGAYYENQLGFTIDWGGEDGESRVSRRTCRLFLTNRGFREDYGNAAPVLVWLNLDSKHEVDELYETWSRSGARIVSRPESKPWKLHEFTVSDLDGNLFRVFYDFSRETAGE
jgi:predicted lactoylglutathione lyase